MRASQQPSWFAKSNREGFFRKCLPYDEEHVACDKVLKQSSVSLSWQAQQIKCFICFCYRKFDFRFYLESLVEAIFWAWPNATVVCICLCWLWVSLEPRTHGDTEYYKSTGSYFATLTYRISTLQTPSIKSERLVILPVRIDIYDLGKSQSAAWGFLAS